MFKGPIFHSIWFTEVMRLLALEAVLVFLFWLLHSYAGFMRNFPFGDVLFIAGGIMLFLAGFGMLRGDTDMGEGQRYRGPTLAVRPTESEAEDRNKQKMSFGIRLAICGFITVLISLAIYLINKAAGG